VSVGPRLPGVEPLTATADRRMRRVVSHMCVNSPCPESAAPNVQRGNMWQRLTASNEVKNADNEMPADGTKGHKKR